MDKTSFGDVLGAECAGWLFDGDRAQIREHVGSKITGLKIDARGDLRLEFSRGSELVFRPFSRKLRLFRGKMSRHIGELLLDVSLLFTKNTGHLVIETTAGKLWFTDAPGQVFRTALGK